MARTSQTARRSDVHDAVVENPDINPEDVEKFKEIEEGDMQAKLKHIDKKFTEKGQQYFAETVEEEIPEQVNWWSKFALCLVRHMDRTNKYVQKISLQVNSQHLKDILRDTIGEFPGVSFLTKDVTIDAPYRVLFHYRKELALAGKNLDNDEAIAHLNLLLDFINEEFKDTIEESENLLEQGMMSYQSLWTIFRPGSTIYAPVLSRARAFTLNSYQYLCDPVALNLNINFVDFDGDDFGTRCMGRMIPAFSGAKKITEMAAYPLDLHEEPDILKRELIERGRQFESLAGMHFRCYKGVAVSDCDRYSIDGRIVIDAKTYHRLNADEAFNVIPFTGGLNRRKNLPRTGFDAEELGTTSTKGALEGLNLDPLTDEQCMIATAMVRGFSFSDKHWLDFFVDKCTPVDWNQQCFDQLVLPKTQKNLVQALVANHVQQKLGFDDIVKGKGKGLIMVLHGPPGVGKTLTAETVAEYCKRPLYMVSSGDLGTNTEVLDQRLSRILDMASTWKAVLLIDEADIFLERRSLHDLERNSLVSIFLRVLEYYEGILFLTSNRVSTFDDAFKSRIHVPLKYNDLTVASRKAIWKNFLEKMEGTGVHINDDDYDSLAQAALNGRQIKNIIRTAKSLAQFHEEDLDREKLEQVIQIQTEFERDLIGLNGTVDESFKNGATANGLVNGHVNGHKG